MSGYCIGCHRVVDVLVTDFDYGPWAVCVECYGARVAAAALPSMEGEQ